MTLGQSATVGRHRGQVAPGGDVAREVGETHLVRVLLVGVFRWRNGLGRLIVFDRFSPSFREEQRTQAVTKDVFAAGTKPIEPDAIYFMAWRRL